MKKRSVTHTLSSDHDEGLPPTEEERVLVDHGLHDVLEVGPRHLKPAHVRELDRKQGRPPAYRQVLAVHGVQLRVVSDPIDGDHNLKLNTM